MRWDVYNYFLPFLSQENSLSSRGCSKLVAEKQLQCLLFKLTKILSGNVEIKDVKKLGASRRDICLLYVFHFWILICSRSSHIVQLCCLCVMLDSFFSVVSVIALVVFFVFVFLFLNVCILLSCL